MDKQNLRKSVLETYGIHRFGERYLRELLPKSVYEELKKVQEGQNELSVETAEAVARAMKDWAVEQGATHYTHWFQPMTGKTAEKHEAFIRPDKDGGLYGVFRQGAHTGRIGCIQVFLPEVCGQLLKPGAIPLGILATVHSAANVAADENQIVMETITKVTQRHELAALLHEKPFAGVNGSGKHINWSLASNDGLNLLEPGNHPEDNLVFLVFLCAMLETVDKYGLLLRASIASAGNDLRLGAHEAPPNIVSIYLGESLTEILDAASCGNNSSCSDNGTAMHLGSFALPNLPKDLSDRNRTSPFAFTGNKFEYRMPPSGESISTAVAVLNAAYAETMSLYAVKLKNHMDSGNSKEEAVRQVLADSWLKHKRIVFNGNAYSESWHKEALARGLLEAKDSVEAFSAWLDPENVRMLTETGVMSRQEIEALSHIEYERYAKRLLVDATTLLHMAERSAIPAAQNYFASLAGTSEKAQALALENPFMPKLKELLKYITESEKHIQGLKAAMKECNKIEYHTNRALLCRNSILPEIGKLRLAIDSLENLVPKNDWPFPAYEQLLFDI